MADAPSMRPSGPDALGQRLAVPEPLCLAAVLIEDPTAEPGDQAITSGPLLAVAGQRLRDTLRPYDELDLLPDGHFVVVLPTLADRDTLASRMHRVYEAVSAPYEHGGETVAVRTLLGAAVRDPQDDTPTFLRRVLDAIEEARADGGRRPILV